MLVRIEIRDVEPIGPFEFRWPDDTEAFSHGWEAIVLVDGSPSRFRYGARSQAAGHHSGGYWTCLLLQVALENW